MPLKIYCESPALVEVSEEKVYSEKLAIIEFNLIFLAFLKGWRVLDTPLLMWPIYDF